MFCFSSLICFFFFYLHFPLVLNLFVLYLLDLIIFSSYYENSFLLPSYHLIFHSSTFFSSVLADQMKVFSFYRYLQCLLLYFNTIFYQLCYEIFLSFVCWKLLQSSLLCNWIEMSCHPPLKRKVSAIVHFPLNLFICHQVFTWSVLERFCLQKSDKQNMPVCLCWIFFFF